MLTAQGIPNTVWPKASVLERGAGGRTDKPLWRNWQPRWIQVPVVERPSRFESGEVYFLEEMVKMQMLYEHM